MVRDLARPGPTGLVVSQVPSHEGGASKGMDCPLPLQMSVLAVSFDGSSHDPFGGSQPHGAHSSGATRWSYPWKVWKLSGPSPPGNGHEGGGEPLVVTLTK